MRRFLVALCAAALGIGLSAVSATAASAWSSRTIVVWPGQSIQAAINQAHPGDTVLVKRGIADDSATGSGEAGFYVGDSPDANTVVRNDQAYGNQFGIFIRHARYVLVTGNRISGNCEGILVLDDGQPGGAGNATVVYNWASSNNKSCPKSEDSPATAGGGIALVGATYTLVAHNFVFGNRGNQVNSGGIVVLSAHSLSGGSNPNFDTITKNTAFGNFPADLRWDGTGTGVRFKHNSCATSVPAGLCR